jgi:phosphate starvation-inducible PhoH-like protein
MMTTLWKYGVLPLLGLRWCSRALVSPPPLPRFQMAKMSAAKRPGPIASMTSGLSYTMNHPVQPRGEHQTAYVQALRHPNHTIVFGTGPAGCGKTMFACYAAVEALQRGEVHKVVLTRPVVSVGEELGFLPGNIQRKMDPWLQPLFDMFLDHYTQRDLDRMIAQGQLEISPLGFMRGRTFKRCFVIADEMQNSSPSQMMMMLTRVGDDSKMVVTGDPVQSDLVTGPNGLTDFLTRYQCTPPDQHSHIAWVRMTEDDVARSPVVKEVLNIYGSTPRPGASKPPSYGDAALIPAQHLK